MAYLAPEIVHRILNRSLPWDRSSSLHIEAFLNEYTLHDSPWIGLLTDCGREDTSIVILKFDTVWNQSVGKPTAHVASWPLLFLRLSCVKSIQMSGFANIDGLGRGISEVSVDHISQEEVVTRIADHFGGNVVIQHFALIDALVMAPDGSVVDLPSLVA